MSESHPRNPSTTTPARAGARPRPNPTQMLLTAANVPPSKTCGNRQRRPDYPGSRRRFPGPPGFGGFRPCHREDASTAFSLWAHRSTIAFFDAVGRKLPPAWRMRPSAATAMAAAYKEASGLANKVERALLLRVA